MIIINEKTHFENTRNVQIEVNWHNEITCKQAREYK